MNQRFPEAPGPSHGCQLLMLARVVLPGYVLMPATGLWMASLAWPFTARWIHWALGLWFVGLACPGSTLAALRKQGHLLRIGSHALARYVVIARASGAAFGLVVAAILCLMVFKRSRRS